MSVQIQIRGDSSTAWTGANPVLADRELGWDKNQSQFKIGNGVSSWNALPYIGIGTGTTFGGTNVSASATLNSAGLALSLSAAAGGGGGGGGHTDTRMIFPEFGFTGITSHTATVINGRLFISPEAMHNDLSASKIAIVQSHTVVSSFNVSQVMSETIWLGLYSKANATQLSLMSSGSASFSAAWSTSNSTGSINGVRELYVTMDVSATAGQYYLGKIISVTGNNASAATAHTISHFGIGQQTAVPNAAEGFGVATNASQQAFQPFHGQYSETTNAFPSTIGLSQMTLQTGTNIAYANFYREYVG